MRSPSPRASIATRRVGCCVVALYLLVLGGFGVPARSKKVIRRLDLSYRPPPIWGCATGLPPGAFHVVVATLAPEPMALVPWIWNLGLTGAEVWIYHRLDSHNPDLTAAAATLAALRPYPCDMSVRLQQLLPNKGREAAVYMSHIVRHYDNLPEGIVFIHDHGPAARHSLCGPFFRRLRGYYRGIREERLHRQNPQRHEAGGEGDRGGTNVSAALGVGARQRFLAAQQQPENQHHHHHQLRRRFQATGLGGEGAGGVGSGVGAARALDALSAWGAAAGNVREVLIQFANQPVSLSSGCQENWLKGCCAQLVCAEDSADEDWLLNTAVADTAVDPSRRQLLNDNIAASAVAAAGSRHVLAAADTAAEYLRSGSGGGGAEERSEGRGVGAAGKRPSLGRCPFKSSRCLANASAVSVPLRAGQAKNGARWVYMHGAGGLYDTRYENLVVLPGMTDVEAAAAAAAGLTNAGFGPLSLVRYAGPDATETVRMQTSSARTLDYPAAGPGAATRTPQETFAELGKILAAHDFAQRKTPGSFKSCCASLMLRPKHLRHWPKSLYEQMLSYTLDERNTYHASLAVSHHGWALWAGGDVSPSDLLRYFEIDLVHLAIRGCPGWKLVAEEVEVAEEV